MKKTVILALLALFCAYPVYAAFPTSGVSQNAYCQIPPYLTSTVKPNINLVLDFSGSMQFPAYMPCTNWLGYGSGNVANCGTYATPAASLLYNTAKDYYGSFKNNMYYKYNASGYFEENTVCTNTDRKGSITTSCLSGNLLNWAVTTRTDVLRKILTGGRLKGAATDVIESEGAIYSVTDTVLHCKFTVTAAATTTRTLAVANQSGFTCAIGTGSGYSIDVKTTTPTTDITGVVQSMYPNMVDLELSVFNTEISNNVAYRTGKNKTVNDYVTAINSEMAIGGTPTGEALRESKYYFQQSSSMTATGKSSVIGMANYLYDPYYETGNLPASCRKSYILLISDGEWNGTVDPVNPAHDMRKNDMRTDAALTGRQNVRTYSVYAFGDGVQGRQAMITTALFGGYDDDDANGWPYGFSSLPSSLTTTYPRSNCNPAAVWNAQCAEWDKEKTGLPSNFYEADEGSALQAAIAKAINDIQANTSSGTAASVMGNNESSGAMLLQALFFPEKQFEASTKATWLGEIQALWLYVDPLLTNISLREDTVSDGKLKLSEDKIASFDFDGSQTRVNLFDDANGNGVADSATPSGNVSVDDVKALWRAGKNLWSRSASTRTIYANDPTVSTYQGSKILFSTSNMAKFKPYLDVANVDADATNVISYALGNDISGYRNRTVTIGGLSNVWKLGDVIGSSPRMLTSTAINIYHNSPKVGGYSDTSYGTFVNSKAYTVRNVAIAGANDGMLHAFKIGKNMTGSGDYLSILTNSDGITSATDLGKELWGFVPKNVLPYLKHLGNPSYKHLYFVNSTPFLVDASIGKVDKYCSVDKTKCSVSTDCSDSATPVCLSVTPCTGAACTKYPASWRTILIGSMGLGGATRDSSASCTDCVKTPVSGIGYSSYFALDVTDPTDPQLLWEFSNPRLGFSTIDPAVMRIRESSDTNMFSEKNGNWYVVLASGPTGPIDPISNQMKGFSDQPLSLFVLDLATGTPLRTFSRDAGPLITGISHTQVASMPDLAFSGSLSDATIDAEKFNINKSGSNSDDGLYLGYTRKDVTTGSISNGKFSKGGILRLLTGDDPNTANWVVSPVIDGVGPVTTSVARLQNTSNITDSALWLYFGTGRYFYKSGAAIDEDFTGQQEYIYGIKEPCYNIYPNNDLNNTACTTSIATGTTGSSPNIVVTTPTLKDQTTTINTVSSTDAGWKVKLALASGTNKAQRIVSNPSASTLGVLFFTAMMPTADICSYGGTSSIWKLYYNSGDAPPSALTGIALMQKTTGELSMVNLHTSGPAPSPGTPGTREVSAGGGGTVAGGGSGGSFVTNANHVASRKILHIQER